MDNASRRVKPDTNVAGRALEGTGDTRDETKDMDQRTRQIRNEIEETRADMSETIEAIQDRLSPSNVVANATETVKTAATQRVRDMAETATETAQQAMDYTRQRATEAMDSARQNSIPLALLGVGAAWLLANRSRGGPQASRGNGYDTVNEGRDSDRESPRTRDSWGYADASQTANTVRRMGRRQHPLLRMINENPLLLGAGALMFGAAFGLAVPETSSENEWMGDARDRLMNRARDVAREAADQVQNTASSIADAAKKVAGQAEP
jgi:hypothetical protein